MIHPVLFNPPYAKAVRHLENRSVWLCNIILSPLKKIGEGQQLECLKANHISSPGSVIPRHAVLMTNFSLGKHQKMAVQESGWNLHRRVFAALARTSSSNELSQEQECRLTRTLYSPALGKCHCPGSFFFPLGASVLATEEIQGLQPDAALWTQSLHLAKQPRITIQN